MYLAQILGIQVQFTDFPKVSEKKDWLSLSLIVLIYCCLCTAPFTHAFILLCEGYISHGEVMFDANESHIISFLFFSQPVIIYSMLAPNSCKGF